MGEAARQHLEAIFWAGVRACRPSLLLPPHLPEPPPGRTIALALGKAAIPMAKAVEENWDGPLCGLAVTPHGAAEPLGRLDVLAAGHPVPDESSVEAALRLLALAQGAGPGDLVLVLLSGGASALACLPGPGSSLAQKQGITTALLSAGAPIGEINCVRKHLSLFKGGRLAAEAYPARLVTLAISDVVGDGPEGIGSGPTVADSSSIDDARSILRRYRIEEPQAGWLETAKSAHGEYRIVGTSRMAIEAAAQEAAQLGYLPKIIGYDCIGEAREVAAAHAALALEAGGPAALISGGELTVTVNGRGSGGPNQEYALALALALDGAPDIRALAADTDGMDGSGEAAGTFVDAGTLKRGGAKEALAENGSGGFFAAGRDLFITGPTGTNVNDLRIILIDP